MASVGAVFLLVLLTFEPTVQQWSPDDPASTGSRAVDFSETSIIGDTSTALLDDSTADDNQEEPAVDDGRKYSPSGRYFAYEGSNADVEGNTVILTNYTREHQYDVQETKEYIMTGVYVHRNFTVTIGTEEDSEGITMDAPMRQTSPLHYQFGIKWIIVHDEELLLAVWSNRWNNETLLALCSYENATCTTLYEHFYTHGQWAAGRDYQNIHYSNTSIFFILPEERGDNSWQHIAKLEITNDFRFGSLSFLPSGDYDILKILPDDYSYIMFYEAQAPNPWNRHVYMTTKEEGGSLDADQCWTCGYTNCTFQEALSVSGEDENLTIAIMCKGPSPPFTASIPLNTIADEIEMQIIDEPNQDNVNITWITETFPLKSGFEAIVRIYEGDSTQPAVPVIMNVYGGPEHNQVEDVFDANPDPIGYKYAIVYVDVRGSGGRGWKYRSAIYGKLVTVEIDDMIEAMQLVLAKYPRFDKDRVAVYGWSYGGTSAIALVEKAPQAFFKCAISGAPVTNFISYDAEYTETYMGDAPPSAYTDLTNDVSAFQHTKLLLIHGLRDDNVLFRHSALLIEALEQAVIPFELMVYPNDDHHVHGSEHSTEHVHQLYQTFLATCFE